MLRFLIILSGTALIAVFSRALAADDEWLLVRDPEFSFQVAFPHNWKPSERRLPNVRAFLDSPAATPAASCNVIARPAASLNGLRQSQLDDELRSHFAEGDWTAFFGSKGMQLQIIESWTMNLDNRFARRAVLEASHGKPPVYVRYTAVLLLRPGVVWALSGGGGTNPVQARQSYSHWENTFNRIVGSVAFEE